jgi:hypothetical protein
LSSIPQATLRYSIKKSDASQQLFAEIFHDFFTPDLVLFAHGFFELEVVRRSSK